MTTSTQLVDMIMRLFTPAEQAAFNADPEAWLRSCGAGDLSPADVHDALVLARDDDDAGRHISNSTHIPPAPHAENGESDHEAAVRYLNTYVTNNYVDDRDTNVDNSVNQHVDTHGGDFDQDIDTHSVVGSGDGSVVAGGDIDGSTVTTGDDNQVGDDNIKGDDNVHGDDNAVLSGDHNTAAFGSGDAGSATFDDTTVDRGGAIAVGGAATGDNDTSDSHDTTTTTTTTDLQDDHSLSYDDHSTTGSHNESDSSSSTDSHNDTTTHLQSDNTVDDHHTA